jgi:hypothetical protein
LKVGRIRRNSEKLGAPAIAENRLKLATMLSARRIGSPPEKVAGLITTLSSLMVGVGQKSSDGASPSDTACPAHAPMSRSSLSRTTPLETARGRLAAIASMSINDKMAPPIAIRRIGHCPLSNVKFATPHPALRFWLMLGEGECNCRFRLSPAALCRQRFESGWLFALQ